MLLILQMTSHRVKLPKMNGDKRSAIIIHVTNDIIKLKSQFLIIKNIVKNLNYIISEMTLTNKYLSNSIKLNKPKKLYRNLRKLIK